MSTAVAQGKLIVLEGIDGSGTTTQARLLAERLTEHGRECILTREPTTGPVGVLLRSALSRSLQDAEGHAVGALDFRAMALLFAADRCDHNQRLIRPALERGVWVISDRYVLSSLIYQSLTSPESDVLPWLSRVNEGARPAELTLVLNVDAVEAARRRAARGGERELYETDSLQRRLADAYAQGERYLGDQPLRHVDGRGTLREVQERIWARVSPLL